MKKNYFVDETSRIDLRYEEVYSFTSKGGNSLRKGVYLGSTSQGMGRILCKEGKHRGYTEPVVFSFTLRDTTLEGNILKGKFSSIFLTDKEKSFALEILTKKGL